MEEKHISDTVKRQLESFIKQVLGTGQKESEAKRVVASKNVENFAGVLTTTTLVSSTNRTKCSKCINYKVGKCNSCGRVVKNGQVDSRDATHYIENSVYEYFKPSEYREKLNRRSFSNGTFKISHKNNQEVSVEYRNFRECHISYMGRERLVYDVYIHQGRLYYSLEYSESTSEHYDDTMNKESYYVEVYILNDLISDECLGKAIEYQLHKDMWA